MLVQYKTGNIRIKSNNEARSFNHCCHIQSKISIYSECEFVALVIQHAAPCFIAICGKSGSGVFSPNYLTEGAKF
jgi:hypothetical protein